jgi:hypothetical protein
MEKCLHCAELCVGSCRSAYRPAEHLSSYHTPRPHPNMERDPDSGSMPRHSSDGIGLDGTACSETWSNLTCHDLTKPGLRFEPCKAPARDWIPLLRVQSKSLVQFFSVQCDSRSPIHRTLFCSVQFCCVQFSSVQFNSVQFSSVQFSSVLSV